MPDIPVSVIIMTRNESKNIVACLESLAGFDEIFVVDSGSDDDTVALAAAHGATVVPFAWNGRYPKKKQWCLESLPFSHDWLLYVDADERLTPDCAAEIADAMASDARRDGYFVGYDYVFMDTTLRFGRRIYKLVLFNRHKGRFLDYRDHDIANMWEVEGHYQPKIEGTTAILKSRMIHRDHEGLFHFFERHNRYSDWEAALRERGLYDADLETQPGPRTLLKRIWMRMPCKGLVIFVYAYFVRLGFLDGRAGFDYALAQAFYFWQIGIKQRELRRRARGVS
ncbi:MAG: glycosyltransferase [Alphaproteobacteria bacterium]|nr:glycosyltransferase [Alphaproteobacteria bacterium]